jgi:hypothetical protein
MKHHPGGCTEITCVLDIEEVTGRLCLYNVSDEALSRSWVTYCYNPEDIWILKSSTVIIISKDTRKVIYAGSAGDEG